MKNLTIILISAMLSNNVFANSEGIQKWDDHVAEKGYILSVDLHNNKKCAKIWTKQIKEFLKKNPQIKDANVILINQKIKVQDCNIEIASTPAEMLQPSADKIIQDRPEWFIGAFMGLSKLAGKSDDTGKEGSSWGVKFGQLRDLAAGKKLSLALGYMENTSETTDQNDALGSYEVKSKMFMGEVALLFPMGKLYLGPKAMLVAGDDTSFREQGNKESVGLYLGASLLSRITKSLDFEVDFQQKADDRLNILGNIGLRINF